MTNKNPRGHNTKTIRLTPETDIEWAANKGQIAETSVIYVRNHLQDLKTDRQENPLTTHRETHGGRYDYSMTVERAHRLAKDRQISEGLNIEKTKADFLLNSK